MKTWFIERRRWLISGGAIASILLLCFIGYSAAASINQSQDELTDKQFLLEELQHEIKELAKDKEELETILSEKEKELEFVQDSEADKLQTMDEKIRDLMNELDKLLEENSALHAEIEILKSELDEALKNQAEQKQESNNGTNQNSVGTTLPKPNVTTSPNAKKKVFLTFDDGPTTLTPLVLDTLKNYQVPASFFVIGQRMENMPEILRRAYNEGHMILPHSYSHDYAIYTSFETFYDDFYRAEKSYKNVLGTNAPKIFRFPGGSSNHSSFDYGGKQFMPMLTVDIKEKGYTYVDWNVSSGDAGPAAGNGEKMKQSIIEQSKGKDFIVLLFHDTAGNKEMLNILPDVIEYYKDRGFAFRSFRDVTKEELKIMEQMLLTNKPIVR